MTNIETILSRIEETLITKYWCLTFKDPSKTPKSVFTALKEGLPHIVPDSWEQRADFGGVYLNGYLVLHDQSVPTPARIEYYEPKFSLDAAANMYPGITEKNFVYNDGDIAILYKPAGLPTTPAKDQRLFSLKRSVESMLKLKPHLPSRLDVSVQGLVVMSVSQRMHGPLQKLYQERKVEKIYRLVSSHEGAKTEWVNDKNIAKSALHPVLREVSEREGQSAETGFKFVSKSESGFLYEARPVTGRTHQIRVHAADSGIPVRGDNFYGGERADGLSLVSAEVVLTHPLSGEELRVKAPAELTPSWVWDIGR